MAYVYAMAVTWLAICGGGGCGGNGWRNLIGAIRRGENGGNVSQCQ